MRQLNRTLQRRIGKLVVTITPTGIELRGYRRRSRRKFVTWQQIASLTAHGELFALTEQCDGLKELGQLGVTSLTDEQQPGAPT